MFGDGLLLVVKVIFKEKGIEYVGNSYYLFVEKEFSGYLMNVVVV